MKTTALKKLFGAVLAAALACALAGCAGQAASESDSQKATESAEQSAEAENGGSGTPVEASALANGDWDISVDSSSSMFKVVAAKLHVADGAMTCTLTLSGTGYGKLFMGTKEEAAEAGEDAFIPFIEDAEGKYTYTVPVEALDADIACAAWSIRKEQWYDRTLVFESESLPAEAFKG